MKAVIPVAGMGTRLLPLTKSVPKEMLPIVNKPAIQYVIEEAVKAGFEDILLITGRHKRAIEDYFDKDMLLESFLRSRGKLKELDIVEHVSKLADLTYIRQKEPKGLGDAVLTARRYISEDYFALLLGDDIFWGSPPVIGQLEQYHSDVHAGIIAVKSVGRSEVSRYGIVRLDSNNRIVGAVEKPDPESAPSNLAIMGRYILPSEIFDYLMEIPPGKGGEVQLTDAIEAMLSEGHWYYAKEIAQDRYDVGNIPSWLHANIEIGKKLGVI